MKRTITAAIFLVAMLNIPWVWSGPSQEFVRYAVTASKGIDPRVDYTKLDQFGPWDDRNYQMTASEVALLGRDDLQFRDPIPAFYRAMLRAKMAPGSRYPRSALNAYRQRYGGYLVNGKLYQGVEYVDGKHRIVESSRIRLAEVVDKFLSNDVRLTSPNGAAESAIAIKPTDENVIVAGTNGPGAGQRMHYSTDGGDTWTQVDLPLGGTCCDPTIGWSTDGQYAYTATLGDCGAVGSACQIWFYRSNDDGVTWAGLESETPGDPRRELTTAGDSDKEFLHVDNFANSPFRDNIYLTWHDNNVMQFARSTDNGNSFSSVMAFGTDPLGIGSDITTDQSGNVYYMWPDLNTPAIVFRKSTDGGASFDPLVRIANTPDDFDFAIPAMETRRVFQYVSADVDYTTGPYANSIYVAWTENTVAESGDPGQNHARIKVAYSRDGGATWNTTVPHQTSDELTVDRFHQWLKVDEFGNVHVIFYDTREDPSRQQTNLYYAFSSDGGQTFSPAQKVTQAASPNIDDGFEYGDYNGLDAIGKELIAVYTDNRSESGAAGNSVDVYASGGFGIFDPTFLIAAQSQQSAACAPVQINGQIDVSSAFGFADTVALSTTLPAGTANANFTPATVQPPSVAQFSFDVESAVTPGLLLVPLFGSSGGTTRSTQLLFDVSAMPPVAAGLTLPVGNALDVFQKPYLSWAGVNDVRSFTIEVATSADFSNVVSTATVTSPRFTVPTLLDENTTYYWRVRSNNPCGETVSDVGQFTTGARVCRTPNLTIPDDTTSDQTDTLTLTGTGDIRNLLISIETDHSYIGDLSFSLTSSASSTTVDLIEIPGNCGRAGLDLIVGDQGIAQDAGLCSALAATQTVQSAQSLTAFDGEALGGDFVLRVVDRFDQDGGTLTRWCVAVSGDSSSGGPTEVVFSDSFETTAVR